ncbi:MAG: methylated-DNA--[protein]-cysteine S-methyltransferase [Thermoplasmata archaeon]|nr:methylated-DNA--[protein]-cysteine S-methyltransferase [Thermoplasmata archaeon]
MKVTSLRTGFGRVDVCEEAEKVRGVVLTDDVTSSGDVPETELSRELARYFAGERVDFSDHSVDFSGYTPFEVKVLRATRRIPYGEVRSYREIAQAVGNPRAHRAVAYTLSKNRSCVVVPDHRVIEAAGRLGGFSAGMEWKVNLLQLEGALREKPQAKA